MNAQELTVKLVRTAANHTGLRASMIIGQGRCGVLCEARWACWAAMRAQGMTLAEIGQAFRRDHATVLVALKRMKNHRGERESEFRELCEVLRQAAILGE